MILKLSRYQNNGIKSDTITELGAPNHVHQRSGEDLNVNISSLNGQNSTVTITDEKLTNGSAVGTSLAAATTMVALPQRVVAGAPRRDVDGDNLRDIGTWSNEQANKQQQQQQRGGNRAAFNNRYSNTVSDGGAKTATQGGNANAEEWENEEEWQGDLTQTQIFTSSSVAAQKKSDVGAPAATTAAQVASTAVTATSGSDQPTTNFPIGHFNAEEAAQNIKNAVGVSHCLVFMLCIIFLSDS